jgi:8-oxo-dGTP pyrophosphatase MutT (NUDIX family)
VAGCRQWSRLSWLHADDPSRKAIVLSLPEIEARLAGHAPTLKAPAEGTGQAAVSMLLHEASEGPSVLFIERARREGDPWSGHMAFPGGRVDPTDRSAQDAAERETLEEIGLSLDGASLIGRLDDKQGNPRTHATLVISAFVYRVPATGPLVPNHEVEHAFWFPVASLLDSARHVPYPAHELEFPGICVGDPQRHVVWGLTYSFLESFFHTLGRPLPNRWPVDMQRYDRSLTEA